MVTAGRTPIPDVTTVTVLTGVVGYYYGLSHGFEDPNENGTGTVISNRYVFMTEVFNFSCHSEPHVVH